MEEMKLWNKVFPEEDYTLQKYLNFRDMAKDPEACPDFKKFVQTNIADNDDFKKEGIDIIDRTLKKIKDSPVATDFTKI